MKLSLTISIIALSFCSSEKSRNTELSGKFKATSAITSKDTFYIQDTPKNEVTGKTITITVSYSAIECGCAQWFETKFENVKFLEGVERFYLEPTDASLLNANDLWDGEHLPLTVKVTGRFSKGKETPISYHIKGAPEKARIFWYEKVNDCLAIQS